MHSWEAKGLESAEAAVAATISREKTRFVEWTASISTIWALCQLKWAFRIWLNPTGTWLKVCRATRLQFDVFVIPSYSHRTASIDGFVPGDSTCLTYCTQGVLLRWLESDPELPGVTHIFADEAFGDVARGHFQQLPTTSTNCQMNFKCDQLLSSIHSRWWWCHWWDVALVILESYFPTVI